MLTDSLTAKAISAAGWSLPAAAVQALRSGADMVLFGPVSNVQAETNAIAVTDRLGSRPPGSSPGPA